MLWLTSSKRSRRISCENPRKPVTRALLPPKLCSPPHSLAHLAATIGAAGRGEARMNGVLCGLSKADACERRL
jgi:hypothetical protein